MLDAGLHEDIGDDLEAQGSVEIYGMELGIKPYLRIAEAALCHFAASSHHLPANALPTIGGSGRHTAYLVLPSFSVVAKTCMQSSSVSSRSG